jgi:hypothetical protein
MGNVHGADGIALDQFGDGRVEGRLCVDEDAATFALEEGDAPAVTVMIGYSASGAESFERKANVRRDIAIIPSNWHMAESRWVVLRTFRPLQLRVAVPIA